jgi:nitroreductase
MKPEVTPTTPANAALDPRTLVRQLEWRYATKRYDPARQISDKDWAALRRALVLSPSSYGLQPWRFFAVSNPTVRAQLAAAAYGQRQVVDASHFVVLAARKGLNAADVQRLIDRVAEVRNVPAASLDGYKQMMLNYVRGRAPGDVDQWSARQVYLALGNLLTSAAVLGIDATPMEGLDAAQFDKILGLEPKGYTSLCAVALGYRAPDDAYASAPKAASPNRR